MNTVKHRQEKQAKEADKLGPKKWQVGRLWLYNVAIRECCPVGVGGVPKLFVSN